MEYVLVTDVVIIVDDAAFVNGSVDGLTVVAVDATTVVPSDGLEPVEIASVLRNAVVSMKDVVIALVMERVLLIRFVGDIVVSEPDGPVDDGAMMVLVPASVL